jgi:hypothetical protein
MPAPLKLTMLLGGGVALSGFASGNDQVGGLGSMAAVLSFLLALAPAWQKGGPVQAAAAPHAQPAPTPIALSAAQSAGRAGATVAGGGLPGELSGAALMATP